jgi:hypothetical protein
VGGRGGSSRWLVVSGIGGIAPRLQVVFAAYPSSYADVELDEVILRLEHRQEVLGEGRTRPGRLQDSTQVVFEVPTTPRLLDYVTASLTPTASTLGLDVKLTGRGRFTRRVEETYGAQVGDPPVGTEREFLIGGGVATPLFIPRSDWYDKVLKPTSGGDPEYLEVTLPAVESPTGEGWRQALARLHDAQRSYALGDDASVFLQLRGALDALPGAPKDIVASITNARKRKAADDVLVKIGAYLHSGRHVSQVGADAGEFPVDHLDAAFAADLMRVVLSHLSVIVAAEVRRAET